MQKFPNPFGVVVMVQGLLDPLRLLDSPAIEMTDNRKHVNRKRTCRTFEIRNAILKYFNICYLNSFY